MLLGDGSCFFYVVRNAFKSIGVNATVDKLETVFGR